MDRGELAALIDQTLLAPTVSRPQMREWLEEQVAFPWASVCVPPAWAHLAVESATPAALKVCSVVGFPLGYDTTEAKAWEAARLVDEGVAEIDMVCRIGALVAGEDDAFVADIEAVVRSVRQASNGRGLVKVILETGYLDRGAITRGCLLVERAGADYVKTSTGFGPRGASADDVSIMRDAVGGRLGVKASGGIRTLDAALAMLEAGATRLGTSAGIEIVAALPAG